MANRKGERVKWKDKHKRPTERVTGLRGQLTRNERNNTVFKFWEVSKKRSKMCAQEPLLLFLRLDGETRKFGLGTQILAWPRRAGSKAVGGLTIYLAEEVDLTSRKTF